MSSARVRQLVREIRKLRAARRTIVVTVREPGDSAPPAASAAPPASDPGAVRVKVWTRHGRCLDGVLDPDTGACSRCGGGSRPPAA